MNGRRTGKRAVRWLDDWGAGAAVGLLVLGYTLDAFRIESIARGVYALAAALGLLAWLMHLRRYRAIHDTPTSRISAAAQGYVELVGRAQAADGRLVLSALTQTPCLWYRTHAWYRQPGDARRGFEEHESDAPFRLLDETGRGQCLVEPRGAEFFVMRKTKWRYPPGQSRHADEFIEWLLLPGDPIHVLGNFMGGAGADGERITRPAHGQPYLIGNIPGRYLAWRHLALALLNLLTFLAGLGLLAR